MIKKYNEINNGDDIVVKSKNLIITMTNTNNQNNDVNQNKTTIHLGECENKLINHYNISDNSSLYILKIDAKEEGMKIPKIEYEVFYPLNGTDLIKLDLSVCQNSRIDISIPIDIKGIDDEIDKYNPSSDYYNDICSRTTSDGGTDISLIDRKNQFINNNMSLCEEDCNLIQYNSNTKKVMCSCLIKTSLSKVNDMKFDKKKLYKSFIDIKNIFNINLMKCFKKVFTKENLKQNYGFYIYIFLFFLYIICLLLFCFKFYSQLLEVIKKFTNIKDKTFKNDNLKNSLTTNNQIIKKKSKKRIKKSRIKNKNGNPPKKLNQLRMKVKSDVDSKNNLFVLQDKIENENINNKIQMNLESKNTFDFTDNELNSLSYDKALIYDKRTFFEYYISKQIIY